MFPLHQGNELCFQISSNPHPQQNIPHDLILDHQLYHGSDMTYNNNGKSRRRRLISTNTDEINMDNGNDEKKLMHRDIERQRRQEMATLYASLRSLLPLEYIKGKRSISDHMHEAANYIKHLRRRIEELNGKRDELKWQTNLRATPSQSGCSSRNCSPATGVIIRPCVGGIELVFSSGLTDQQGLTLSGALQILLQDGISVVNCVSAKVNDMIFHTIQAEVKDPTCLNLSELQQRLTPVVPRSSDVYSNNNIPDC